MKFAQVGFHLEGVTYHPTFLYESLWSMVIFVILIVLRRYNPKRGQVFLTYAIGYSIGRFFIEGMRTDSLYLFGEIRTAQMVSILFIVTSIIIMIYRHRGQVPDPPNNNRFGVRPP